MNRVTHFDIKAKDPKRATEFYGNIFGWRFEKWDGPMEYWMIMTGDEKQPGIDGGMSLEKDSQGFTNQTIEVDDLDQTIKHVKSHGGKIHMKKTAIPGVGWFASFSDPEGNAFGIMQTDKNATE
jgi:predicted enzyme related to lactoylglutathione lyase